jgi:hypothetical protein
MRRQNVFQCIPLGLPPGPWTMPGLDAGLGQITVGLAWWYRQYTMEQAGEDASRYQLAENEAHAQRACGALVRCSADSAMGLAQGAAW